MSVSTLGSMKGWIMTGALLALSATHAQAQDVRDHIRLAPVPDYVVPVEAPAPLGDTGRELSRALVDYQNQHGRESDRYFTRLVLDLDSAAGVEDVGTISIDFDPSYETVALHHVDILRAGERIDGIDLSEAMVFRTETDRDQMIFNGTLTFSMPVLDLRVGDRLDYAYTLSGRNPAIGPHFLSRRVFGTSSDIARQHLRVMVADGMAVFDKQFNDAPKPAETRDGAWRVFTWDAPDPAVNDYDADVPSWAYTRPTYEMSSLEAWGDAGDLFAPHYVLTEADRQAVAPIVAAIAAEAGEDPALRARLALDWVQTNIRYVGIEIGAGGFVPRRPARVVRRRFGDCKDVTLLLLGLLDGLGVEAHGLLVNTEERGGEFDGLPHPYAFDHIIVAADVNGRTYALDATRDPQLGTLETMDVGHIRRGLRLDPGASAVIDVDTSDYPVREMFEETFDLESDPETIGYTFVYTEYGEYADSTAAWLARSGRDGVEQDMVDYLRTRFPSLDVVEPLTVDFDHDAARSEMRMGATLDRGKELETRVYQILAAMPDFDGADRRSPYALDHPRSIRHVRRYIGDDDYAFTAKKKVFETDSFAFTAVDTVEDGHTLVEDYTWRTKRDHIPTDSFAEEMETIADIRDWGYTTVTLGALGTAASAGSGGLLASLLPLLMVLGLGFGVAAVAKRGKARRYPNAS